MTPVDPHPQTNFLPNNIPQDSAAFYNSRAFAENELHVFGAFIKIMQDAFEKGQQQIKDAIKGLS